MGTIGERLREERDRMGLTQGALADLIGQSKKSQMRYEGGQRSPDGNYLAALSDAGADVTYILTGVRTISALPGTSMHQFWHMHEQLAPALEVAKAAENLATTDIDGEQFITVPFYNVHLAAGAGALNDDRPATSLVAFHQDWFVNNDISPIETCIVLIRGDSMEPSLSDGDPVMIDTAKKTVRNGRIYAFVQADGEARVKRLRHIKPNGIALISDNETHDLEIVTGEDANDLKIIGEVVWSGHKWG